MSNKIFANANNAIEQARLSEQEFPALQGFDDTTMTALSLHLLSASQNQQKTTVSPDGFAAAMISAGWNTDLNDKNFFNNQIFDSAVFLRSSNFKRHPGDRLH